MKVLHHVFSMAYSNLYEALAVCVCVCGSREQSRGRLLLESPPETAGKAQGAELKHIERSA